MKKTRLGLLLMMFFVLLLSGCATIPKYIAPDFKERNIKNITLLPVIDARQKPTPDNQKQVVKKVKQFVKYRGYVLDSTDDQISFPNEIKPGVTVLAPNGLKMNTKAGKEQYSIYEKDAMVRSIDPQIIKSIVADSSTAIGVIQIHKVKRSYWVIGSSGEAQISFFLFDHATGELIWYDNAFGSYSDFPNFLAYGIAPMILVAPITYSAANNLAITQSVSGFTRCLPKPGQDITKYVLIPDKELDEDQSSNE